MSITDFLSQYFENANQDFRNLNLECQYCPMRAQCAKDETERQCGEFLNDTIKEW